METYRVTYHLASLDDRDVAACGSAADGDIVVPRAEVFAEGGRHFNCRECHKVLTGGARHAPGPQ